MPKVLVTGGCGYLGSHALVELLTTGLEPVCVDDNSRSGEGILEGVARIAGRRLENHRVDLRDADRTEALFAEHRDAAAVIHFAAYKRAPESAREPLLYYDNNVNSLLNCLAAADRHGIPGFIFSSSCAVYGQPRELPVAEDAKFGEPENPYARTKQVGELILRDLAPRTRTRLVALRYFNAAGAHESGEIGEAPWGEPDNLVPRITRAAAGTLPGFVIHGDDYETRDGTCVRDYVHASDIARAHVLALDHLPQPGGPVLALNLGSGTGTTVLEAVRAFERAAGRRLDCRVGPRRAGDAAAVYGDNRRAAEILGWRPEFGIDDIMRTAWQWAQRHPGGAG
jgi:UDP-glucose 4-epimerase